MTFVLQPWRLLLTILAGRINRQREVIEHLRTENQALKDAHGKRQIRLNGDQRRRLAVKSKPLGRKVLREIGAIDFTTNEVWTKSGLATVYLALTRTAERDVAAGISSVCATRVLATAPRENTS